MIGITPLPFSALLAISVVGALSAPLLALVLATAAPNKVAGLAVVKVLNGLNLLPSAAFFLPTPLQYVAGIIPTYWPMRAFWSAAAGERLSGVPRHRCDELARLPLSSPRSCSSGDW